MIALINLIKLQAIPLIILNDFIKYRIYIVKFLYIIFKNKNCLCKKIIVTWKKYYGK